MQMADIRQKAKEMGVKNSGKRKEIIRSIQKAEGNEPCFGTKSACAQMDCCWREDCQSKASRV